MLALIRLFLGSLVMLFRSWAAMAAENLALRHQLGILLWSKPPRLPLTSWDRALWAFILQRFPGWRQRLVIVIPETVIAWHRQAFRLFWRRKSQAGRPRAHTEVRRLIREMASDNPTWGAPRIHGELLKLCFDVSERTVSRYLERIRPEPRRTGSQTHGSSYHPGRGLQAAMAANAKVQALSTDPAGLVSEAGDAVQTV
jgi:putative transposase